MPPENEPPTNAPEMDAARSVPPAEARGRRVPLIATYRLQLHAGFPLEAASEQLDFLAQLGISHLYASPLLQARAGSLHGYDVTDPSHLDSELGSEADLAALADGLARRRMGLIVDMVPNHMAADAGNPWWWSVLSYGRESPYAHWFDIDWQARGAGRETAGRVLLPVLGAPLPSVLKQGELEVDLASPGHPMLRYYQHSFPLNPVPPAERLDAAALRRWLDRQPYRLSYWRMASQQINYRRFFAINELVGFRVEVPEAFAASHACLALWLRRGWVQGVRIDHVDGLFDPGAYLERVRALMPSGGGVWVEKILADSESLPRDWPVEGTTGYDFLALCDRLQIDPAGYEALVAGYRRFLHRRPEFPSVVYGLKRQVIRSLFNSELRAFARGVAALARHATAPAAAGVSEASAQRVLLALAACYPVYRTYVHGNGEHGPEMSEAGKEAVLAALHGASAREPSLDPGTLAWTGELLRGGAGAGLAPRHWPQWLRFLQRWQQFTAPVMAKGQEDTALYVYVPLASLDEVGGDPSRPSLPVPDFHRRMERRRREQPRALNASSTHDTKRSEDVRARLNALAEIPSEWLAWVRQWSRWNRPWRQGLDRRPAPGPNTEYLYYQTLLGAWPLEDLAPDDAGAVRAPAPVFISRLAAYMRKAAREAAIETQWAEPNLPYERALGDFVAATLDPVRSPRFLAAVRAAGRRLAPAGAVNSLAQLTLKVLAPGVPDFYQGCERWNFSLVDPDNRRAVEFDTSRRSLERMLRSRPNPAGLWDHWIDGEIKLWLTARLLDLRRRHPAVQPEGEYRQIPVAGTHAGHALAFCRSLGEDRVLVAVPRGLATLASWESPGLSHFEWGDTRLELSALGTPPGGARWRDALAGDPDSGTVVESASELPAGTLFQHLPVAVWVAGR